MRITVGTIVGLGGHTGNTKLKLVRLFCNRCQPAALPNCSLDPCQNILDGDLSSIEFDHAPEEDVAATNLNLGILDVFIKVRPEKPKPGRCINLWVERKWRTIGSKSPACRFQAFLNTFVSSTVIRMF